MHSVTEVEGKYKFNITIIQVCCEVVGLLPMHTATNWIQLAMATFIIIILEYGDI